MTEMMNSTAMEDMHLGANQDRNSYQIFPDPTDFERCCKLQECLPSIVVEPTEGEVESGELRWPPEDFSLCEENERRECNAQQESHDEEAYYSMNREASPGQIGCFGGLKIWRKHPDLFPAMLDTHGDLKQQKH